jgi:hypothetical protein
VTNWRPWGTLLRSRGGWWGVAFVVGLLVVGAMASLPTAAQSGERIKAFYQAHRPVIVVQQQLGALLLVPFLGFVGALVRRARARRRGRPRWVRLAGLLFAGAALATNLPPLVLAALPDPSPATAHTLMLVEDLADAALFVAIAVFALVAALAEPPWLRLAGLVVAGLALVRPMASPLGVTAVDAAAPIAVLAFALALSGRALVPDRARRS